ncbi:hypothetical protein J7E49_06700 [Variovorax paradoxus]|nr:hypothetical protein [Variovorax paradoxus]
MPKVSTRPQKTATLVAKAVTAVAEPAVTSSAQLEDWRPTAIKARERVMQLLERARATDENERDDSLDMAKRLLSLAIFDFDIMDDEEKGVFVAANLNCKALITAALNLTHDAILPNVHLDLRHALGIVKALAGHLAGDVDVFHVVDAIRMAPAPAAPLRGQLESYNAKQLECVLEIVAVRTRTLHQILVLLQGSTIEDAHARDICLSSASTIACSIGAIADGVIGDHVYGDANCWNFGRSFANEGRAVSL